MQPFTDKFAYRNATETVNLARVIRSHDFAYDPDVLTRDLIDHGPSKKFKKVVHAHSAQSAYLLDVPIKVGVAVAAVATGGYTLLGYAATVLSGAGTGVPPSSQARRRIFLNEMFERGILSVSVDEMMKIADEAHHYGVLGRPACLARNRAEKAYDAGQGLAHAAWTGLAIGLNALLWMPRTASAVLQQATAFIGAIIGACAGAIRFSWDACAYHQSLTAESKSA